MSKTIPKVSNQQVAANTLIKVHQLQEKENKIKKNNHMKQFSSKTSRSY